MSDFLAEMALSSHRRVTEATAVRSADALYAMLDGSSLPPRLRLGNTFNIIAEIKGHSPAEGALADHDELDCAKQAEDYAAGGAAAISVLTEPERFAGDLIHLADVSRRLGVGGVPAMRKDFLVSTYQLMEARLAGAGGVLLIVAMLDDATLAAMIEECQSLQLFVLLECFDDIDIRRSQRLLEQPAATDMVNHGQFMLGVNTRNLRTLAVDGDRLQTLAPLLPRDVVRVAESGLKTPEDVTRVAGMGYQAALIGTALMKSDDPSALVRSFIAAATA